jgi:hypothetical protein
MRIGTTIILIVAILISFGYVLSDNIHVRRDLQEITGKIDQANSLAAKANENLKSCQATVSNQNAELQSLRVEVSQLAEKNSKLEGENGKLQTDQPKGALLNMTPVAVIVIVVAQIALFLTQKMQKVKLGIQMPLTDHQEKSQSVCLTKEELKTIIEMRRKK